MVFPLTGRSWGSLAFPHGDFSAFDSIYFAVGVIIKQGIVAGWLALTGANA